MKTKSKKTAASAKSKKAPASARDLKPKKDPKGGVGGASGGIWKNK
jgi:hypothetical protein